jgi:hypothetical protein
MRASGIELMRGGRRRRWSGAFLALLVLALCVPAAALASGTIDQQDLTFGVARGLIGTHDDGSTVMQAQTFRAGATGILDQVDLPVRVVGNPGVSLSVQIRSLDGGGAPSGTVLGSTTVLASDLPSCNTAECQSLLTTSDFSTFSFQSIILTSPAAVSSGTSYAIVLSAVGAQLGIYGDISPSNRYEWAGTSDQSAYTNGQSFGFLGSFGSWNLGNADLAFITHVSPPSPYAAAIQQPVNADGSSVFKAGKGAVPVKFTLTNNGQATCALPAATLRLTQTDGSATGTVNESAYTLASDSGSSFRISECQYVYNLSTKALSTGTYRVEILIGSTVVGSAMFDLR